MSPRAAYKVSIMVSPPRFSRANKAVGTGPHLAMGVPGITSGLFLTDTIKVLDVDQTIL